MGRPETFEGRVRKWVKQWMPRVRGPPEKENDMVTWLYMLRWAEPGAGCAVCLTGCQKFCMMHPILPRVLLPPPAPHVSVGYSAPLQMLKRDASRLVALATLTTAR